MQIPYFHADDGTGDDPEVKFVRWAKKNYTSEQAFAIFVEVAEHWLDGGDCLDYAGMQHIVDKATSEA